MQCYPFIHSDDPDCAEAADDLQLVCAHDCPAQPLQWLWPEKIPLGKVTLLIGDPGAGKSLVALDVAARASRGGPWPGVNDEARMTNGETTTHSSFDIRHSSFPASGSPPPAPCSTLILSASDDLADTIRPRLDAAGADPRRVFVIPSIADLRDDFKQLRLAVSRVPNCRLIVIDPINAYVGPGDSHFQTVVRKVLAPLARLAAEKSIAVIAIAHLRKSEGDAIYRAAGSMGFVASARAVWSVARDPDNPSRHLLLPVKNNVAPAACGLAYTIQPTGPLAAPALVWDPTPIDREHMPVKLRRQEAADLHPVRLWLRDELAQGPRAAGELLEAAAQLGFHERTVRRALVALGGHTQHRGILDGWWWSLPPETSTDQPHPKEATTPLTQTHEETVRLCPLPEIFTNPPADNPPWPHSAAPPSPNPQSPASPHSSFDIRHSSFPANPQSESSSPAAAGNPKSPSVSQSIAAINRLDRQRHNDRRPNARANDNGRPPSTTGHPFLDALLAEFRKSPPTTSTPRRVVCGDPQHRDTS